MNYQDAEGSAEHCLLHCMEGQSETNYGHDKYVS